MAVMRWFYCFETWHINRELNHCDGVTVVCDLERGSANRVSEPETLRFYKRNLVMKSSEALAVIVSCWNLKKKLSAPSD